MAEKPNLTEAIEHQAQEKAKREPLLADQGRQAYEPIQDDYKPERP